MMTLKVCLLLFSLAISISSIKAQETKKPVPTVEIKRKQCHSNNDPHIYPFSGPYFNFHKIGKFCLHRSNYFTVEAQFAKCPAPFTAATCNCAIRIDLAGSNNFAEINFCGINDPGVGTVTFLNSQINCVGATFNPLNENAWASVTSVGPGFKCIKVGGGKIWIKSELSNPNDNVFVGITVGNLVYSPDLFPNFVEVHVPQNVTSKGCNCLCDTVLGAVNKGTIGAVNEDITILTDEQNKQVERYLPICKNVLLGEKIELLNNYRLLSKESQQQFDIFATNCATDMALVDQEANIPSPGLFQLGAIRTEICLLALNSQTVKKVLELVSDSVDGCVKELTL